MFQLRGYTPFRVFWQLTISTFWGYWEKQPKSFWGFCGAPVRQIVTWRKRDSPDEVRGRGRCCLSDSTAVLSPTLSMTFWEDVGLFLSAIRSESHFRHKKGAKNHIFGNLSSLTMWSENDCHFWKSENDTRKHFWKSEICMKKHFWKSELYRQ